MKKLLYLSAVLALVLSAASCTSETVGDETFPDHGRSGQTTTESVSDETTTTEYTTTVNHPYDGTSGLPSNGMITTETATTETTTATETTHPSERYEIGMQYVRNYTACIVTDGEEYEPYTSTIYCQNPYMTGDGILMFVSMEYQLPHWIEDDVIPFISLNENSDVRFVYHEDAELQHTGNFSIYLQKEDGSFYQAAELKQSNLSEVVAYGNEHFDGQTVYISYPFMLKYGDYSHLTDGIWGDQAVHDIMCVFKTIF